MLFFFGYSLPAPPFPPGAPNCVPASPCRKAGAGAMSACGNRFSSAPAGRPRCPATSPPCFARHIIPRIAPYEKNFCRKIPPVLRTSPLHAFGIKGGTAACHAGAPPARLISPLSVLRTSPLITRVLRGHILPPAEGLFHISFPVESIGHPPFPVEGFRHPPFPDGKGGYRGDGRKTNKTYPQKKRFPRSRKALCR